MLLVVFTTPASFSGIVVELAAAAAPVTCPVRVSVPDIGAVVALALVLLLLALLPDDEHAPSPAASAMAPVRAASFLMISSS
jgi:hypothetical protein